jgi:hypothetical protein
MEDAEDRFRKSEIRFCSNDFKREEISARELKTAALSDTRYPCRN